jgi:hypothetical protein
MNDMNIIGNMVNIYNPNVLLIVYVFVTYGVRMETGLSKRQSRVCLAKPVGGEEAAEPPFLEER